MTTLELKGQLCVIDAQAIKNGRLQIMHVNRIFNDVVAVIVGFAERHAGLDAAAGHPHGEAAAMMIAAVIGGGQRPGSKRCGRIRRPRQPACRPACRAVSNLESAPRSLVHILAALGQFDRADCRDDPSRDDRAE